ncbi:hypothetical protein B0T14DRAFT_55513 [Immersiella caudata]|uniref:Uncharacterized protein n=1 Tax=Immersiella caudata TaxID=314043 RepID=A0AA39XFS4_9PEZI|nr:hypothetical protein B0T14DRAFT_55513 [Immersiella caudata]
MQPEALAAGPMALRQMSGIGPKKSHRLLQLMMKHLFAVTASRRSSNTPSLKSKTTESKEIGLTAGCFRTGVPADYTSRLANWQAKSVWISPPPLRPRRRGQTRLDGASRITAASQGRVHCTKELTRLAAPTVSSLHRKPAIASSQTQQANQEADGGRCACCCYSWPPVYHRTPSGPSSRQVGQSYLSQLAVAFGLVPMISAWQSALSGHAEMMLEGLRRFASLITALLPISLLERGFDATPKSLSRRFGNTAA